MTTPSPDLLAAVTAAIEARGCRREGTELRMRCPDPAHEDVHPSARWHPERGVWRCDACGLGGGAVDLAARLGVPLPARDDAGQRGRREMRWTIRDAAGTPVAVHVRVDEPRGAKRYVWQQPDGSAGLGGRPASTLPLYSGERLAAQPGARVVVAEGERATDALTRRSVLAVGTVTGASGTPDADVLRVLAGGDVVLWPDADDVGRAHMARIAERLVAVGVTPRWVTVPGTADGDDAADYGGTDAELGALLDGAPAWQLADTDAARERVGILLADVAPEPVAWLWGGRLARGKLTLLEGRPDEGKTTVALDLAARVTTGAPMPGEATRRAPAGVVVVTAEDGLGDTIRPRLDAAGADLTRVLAPTPDEVVSLDEAGLAWLRRACARVDAALVVLDPLVALMPGAVDAHRDQDVRRMLRPLRALAEDCRVAILAVRHLRKAAAPTAKDAGGGSVGIGAAARIVMLAAPDPGDPDRRVLARTKGNLAPPWPSRAYRLVPAEGGSVRVEWLDESPHSADALLSAVTAAAAERVRVQTQEATATRRQAETDARMQRQDVAIEQLAAEVQQRADSGASPLRLAAAVAHMHALGVPRDAARTLLDRHDGERWQLHQAADERGRPTYVLPITDGPSPEKHPDLWSGCGTSTLEPSISPAAGPQGPEKYPPPKPNGHMGSGDGGISPAASISAEVARTPGEISEGERARLAAEADDEQEVAV